MNPSEREESGSAPLQSVSTQANSMVRRSTSPPISTAPSATAAPGTPSDRKRNSSDSRAADNLVSPQSASGRSSKERATGSGAARRRKKRASPPAGTDTAPGHEVNQTGSNPRGEGSATTSAPAVDAPAAPPRNRRRPRTERGKQSSRAFPRPPVTASVKMPLPPLLSTIATTTTTAAAAAAAIVHVNVTSTTGTNMANYGFKDESNAGGKGYVAIVSPSTNQPRKKSRRMSGTGAVAVAADYILSPSTPLSASQSLQLLISSPGSHNDAVVTTATVSVVSGNQGSNINNNNNNTRISNNSSSYGGASAGVRCEKGIRNLGERRMLQPAVLMNKGNGGSSGQAPSSCESRMAADSPISPDMEEAVRHAKQTGGEAAAAATALQAATMDSAATTEIAFGAPEALFPFTEQTARRVQNRRGNRRGGGGRAWANRGSRRRRGGKEDEDDATEEQQQPQQLREDHEEVKQQPQPQQEEQQQQQQQPTIPVETPAPVVPNVEAITDKVAHARQCSESAQTEKSHDAPQEVTVQGEVSSNHNNNNSNNNININTSSNSNNNNEDEVKGPAPTVAEPVSSNTHTHTHAVSAAAIVTQGEAADRTQPLQPHRDETNHPRTSSDTNEVATVVTQPVVAAANAEETQPETANLATASNASVQSVERASKQQQVIQPQQQQQQPQPQQDHSSALLLSASVRCVSCDGMAQLRTVKELLRMAALELEPDTPCLSPVNAPHCIRFSASSLHQAMRDVRGGDPEDESVTPRAHKRQTALEPTNRSRHQLQSSTGSLKSDVANKTWTQISDEATEEREVQPSKSATVAVSSTSTGAPREEECNEAECADSGAVHVKCGADGKLCTHGGGGDDDASHLTATTSTVADREGGGGGCGDDDRDESGDLEELEQQQELLGELSPMLAFTLDGVATPNSFAHISKRDAERELSRYQNDLQQHLRGHLQLQLQHMRMGSSGSGGGGSDSLPMLSALDRMLLSSAAPLGGPLHTEGMYQYLRRQYNKHSNTFGFYHGAFGMGQGSDAMFEAVEREKRHFLEMCRMVCHRAKFVMERESLFPYVMTPAFVLGDIHGNAKDLFFFLENILSFNDILLTPANVLFLGDYVDRGPYSLECVILLLSLKVECPEKVTLLRGNHEDRVVCGDRRTYGNDCFLAQCERLFGPTDGRDIFYQVTGLFKHFPLAAELTVLQAPNTALIQQHRSVAASVQLSASHTPITAASIAPDGGLSTSDRGGAGGGGGGGTSATCASVQSNSTVVSPLLSPMLTPQTPGATVNNKRAQETHRRRTHEERILCTHGGIPRFFGPPKEDDCLSFLRSNRFPRLVTLFPNNPLVMHDAESQPDRNIPVPVLQKAWYVMFDLMWSDPTADEEEDEELLQQALDTEQRRQDQHNEAMTKRNQQQQHQHHVDPDGNHINTSHGSTTSDGSLLAFALPAATTSSSSSSACASSPVQPHRPPRKQPPTSTSTPAVKVNEWGFAMNTRGSNVVSFSAKAVDLFLSAFRFSMLFRAHQEKAHGLRLSKNRKVLTIFSSSNYLGHGNGAGCVVVKPNGEIQMIEKVCEAL